MTVTVTGEGPRIEVAGSGSTVEVSVTTGAGGDGYADLGNAATRNVGTTAGTVAAGDDARFAPTVVEVDAAGFLTFDGGGLPVIGIPRWDWAAGAEVVVDHEYTPDIGDLVYVQVIGDLDYPDLDNHRLFTVTASWPWTEADPQPTPGTLLIVTKDYEGTGRSRLLVAGESNGDTEGVEPGSPMVNFGMWRQAAQDFLELRGAVLPGVEPAIYAGVGSPLVMAVDEVDGTGTVVRLLSPFPGASEGGIVPDGWKTQVIGEVPMSTFGAVLAGALGPSVDPDNPNTVIIPGGPLMGVYRPTAATISDGDPWPVVDVVEGSFASYDFSALAGDILGAVWVGKLTATRFNTIVPNFADLDAASQREALELDTAVTSSDVSHIVRITAADLAALDPRDPNTLYVVIG